MLVGGRWRQNINWYDWTDSPGGQIWCQHLSVCWLSWEPTLRPAVAAAQNHLVATLRITTSHRHTVTPPQYTFYNHDLSPICRSAVISRLIILIWLISNTSHHYWLITMRRMFVSFLYNFDVAGSQLIKIWSIFRKSLPSPLRKGSLYMFGGRLGGQYLPDFYTELVLVVD